MSDWHWVYDITKRQVNGIIQPSIFQQRVSAAKSMVQHFELEHKLEYHDGCVNSLHFNEKGSLLASGSDDLKVVLWDWQRRKPVATFISDHNENVFQAKFMPLCCDRVIVSAARDGQIFKTILSCDGEIRENKRVASHRGAAHKLALLSGNPHVFLSCGEDALVYEIDLREDQPKKLVTVRGEEKHRKVPLYTIFSNPTNINEFATAGRDQYARVYDRRKLAVLQSGESAEPLKCFYPHHLNGGDRSENITCLVYSYDGKGHIFVDQLFIYA
jgi:WD repeat-containing protein 42A